MKPNHASVMRLLFAALIPLVFSGCTSIMGAESTRDNVVIRDHALSGSGESAVFSSARNYCSQYGAKSVLRNKVNASFLKSEYDYYYFDCSVEQPKPLTIYRPSSSSTPISTGTPLKQ
jgi:uncharacterized protein YcfL